MKCANTNGSTPLHEAAKTGNSDTLRLLLERGADVTARDNFERTPLLIATDNCTDVAPIALLLSKGAAVNVVDKDGCTPLHNACHQGCLEAVKMLLDNKAQLEAKSASSRTPLFHAVKGGHLPVVQLLIKAGTDVHVKDANGSTLLHESAEGGSDDVMKFLLSSGAKVDIIFISITSFSLTFFG